MTRLSCMVSGYQDPCRRCLCCVVCELLPLRTVILFNLVGPGRHARDLCTVNPQTFAALAKHPSIPQYVTMSGIRTHGYHQQPTTPAPTLTVPKDWFHDDMYGPEEAHNLAASTQLRTSQTAIAGSDEDLEPRSIYLLQVQEIAAMQPGPVEKHDPAEETDEEFVDDSRRDGV